MLRLYTIVLLTIRIGHLVWADVSLLQSTDAQRQYLPPTEKDIEPPFEKSLTHKMAEQHKNMHFRQENHKAVHLQDLKMPPAMHDPKMAPPSDYDKRRKDCEEQPECAEEYRKPQSRTERLHASEKQPPTLVDDHKHAQQGVAYKEPDHKRGQYAYDHHEDTPNYKQLGVVFTYDDPEIARHYGERKYDRLHITDSTKTDHSDDQRRDDHQKTDHWHNAARGEHESVLEQTDYKHDLHSEDQHRMGYHQVDGNHDHHHGPYESDPQHKHEAHHEEHKQILPYEKKITDDQHRTDHHYADRKEDHQHDIQRHEPHYEAHNQTELHSNGQHGMGYRQADQKHDHHHEPYKSGPQHDARKHEADHAEHKQILAYEKKHADDQHRTDHHYADRKEDHQHNIQRHELKHEVHKQTELYSNDQQGMGYRLADQKHDLQNECHRPDLHHGAQRHDAHHEDHKQSFPHEKNYTDDRHRADQRYTDEQQDHQHDIKKQEQYQSIHQHHNHASRYHEPKQDYYTHDHYSDLDQPKQFEQHYKYEQNQHDQSRSHEPKPEHCPHDHYSDLEQHKQLEQHHKYEHNQHDQSRSGGAGGSGGQPVTHPHEYSPPTITKSQPNERYRISKPKGIPDPPLRSHLRTPDDLSTRAELPDSLFAPAGSDPYNNRFATFTNAPYSIFHTQLNLDSPGNQFNVANTFPASVEASSEDAVRVPTGAEGNKAIAAALKVNYTPERSSKPTAAENRHAARAGGRHEGEYHYNRPSISFEY